MTRSKIEWTDAVWNPVTGCTKVSPGCAHCYAERMAKRLAGRVGYHAEHPFHVTLHPDRLEQPLRWRTPRRVFVCSMGDLFNEDVPGEFIIRVLRVIEKCPKHTFMILTKRPERMLDVIGGGLETGLEMEPLPNLWLGVSAENQETADQRIYPLLRVPAAVRFVSCEPLLGPIDLTTIAQDAAPGFFGDCLQWYHRGECHRREGIDYPHLNWVIVGGESGPGARPCDIAWIRSIIEQCKVAEVPVFAKQLGENSVGTDRFPSVPEGHKFSRKGNDLLEWPVDLQVRQWPEGSR